MTITLKENRLFDRNGNVLLRFKVYRSSKAHDFLCICAGRDKRHALKIARQIFTLDKTAFSLLA